MYSELMLQYFLLNLSLRHSLVYSQSVAGNYFLLVAFGGQNKRFNAALGGGRGGLQHDQRPVNQQMLHRHCLPAEVVLSQFDMSLISCSRCTFGGHQLPYEDYSRNNPYRRSRW